MVKRSKKMQIVEKVLRDYPQSRNSDKTLIIIVMQMMGAQLTPDQMRIIKSVSFEGITRARRKFQENGQYLAHEAIAKEREIKSLEVQQTIPQAKPESVQPLIERKQQSLL